MIRNNIASDSQGAGFAISDTGHIVTHNTSVGNLFGFVIATPAAGSRTSFHFNSMIGNRLCGLLHNTSTNLGVPIDATNNYWGSPSGAGPKPADAAPNVPGCRGNVTNTVVVVPFSPEPF